MRSLVLIALLFAGFSHATFAKKHRKSEPRQQKVASKGQKKSKSSTSLSAKKQQKATLKQQKEALKAWKKRKAAMPPMQLKALIEENDRLKRQVKEIWTTQEALKEMLKFKARLLAQKEEQRRLAVEDAQKSALSAQEDSAHSAIGSSGSSKYEWAMDEDGRYYIKGIIFKVQIGAYKQRDLQYVLEGEENQEIFVQEKSGDLNRYTLMYFRDYWQANRFKKELRAMGLKDAFVVAFQDGKHAPLEAVLSEVIQQKGE